MLTGVSGLAGSGKDTAAQFLVQDHQYIGMAFADEMKRICKRVYDFTDQQLWGPSQYRNAIDERYPRQHTIYEAGKSCACCGCEYPFLDRVKCYLTPRYALQKLGTEWGRDCFPATWVDLTVRDAHKLLAPEGQRLRYDQKKGLWHDTSGPQRLLPGVVVTDVRFLNEIAAIQQAGGRVIRVLRTDSGLQGEQGQHQSETEQAAVPDSAFDAVIQNDGTLEELHRKVQDIETTVLRG